MLHPHDPRYHSRETSIDEQTVRAAMLLESRAEVFSALCGDNSMVAQLARSLAAYRAREEYDGGYAKALSCLRAAQYDVPEDGAPCPRCGTAMKIEEDAEPERQLYCWGCDYSEDAL